ncbi:MAG: hypothetical protein OXT65_10515 [Alphaproteobacteria bacterium]|nr:hypothetical protein [Alphaproteobacteria bacterium]
MKKHILPLMLVLVPVLALTACGPNRQQADQKILNACLAALKTVHGPDDSIDLQEKTFESSKSQTGSKLRTVKIRAYLTKNRGMIEEKNFSCTFDEVSGLFGYSPEFYSMDAGGRLYGNVDGVIKGGVTEMMNITAAVEAELR